MFIAALFIIASTWKQPRCPSTDEWIRKLGYIYTMEYYSAIKKNGASLVAQSLKRLPGMWETWVRSLGREDPLKKEMATHSSILVWRIPWAEESGGLQSTGLQKVGHDWATSLSLWLGPWNGGGNGKPLQYSCLGNPMDQMGYNLWGHKESDTTELHAWHGKQLESL